MPETIQDPEIRALSKIVSEIETLDADARTRIVEYISQRYIAGEWIDPQHDGGNLDRLLRIAADNGGEIPVRKSSDGSKLAVMTAPRPA